MSQANSSTDLDDSVLAVSHEGQRHHENTNLPNYIEVIIDTGATKSVIGTDYLNELVSRLSKTERDKILQEKEGKKLEFKFGNGVPTSTLKVIHIPVDIQGEKKTLKFYVLLGRVPCSIGMQALTKLGVMINLSLPAVSINGRKLEVRETEAGHLV